MIGVPTDSVRRPWLKNPTDDRFRAGWRILGFLLLFYSLALPLVFGLQALLDFGKRSPWVIVLIALSASVAVLLARRHLDKRSITSLGLTLNRSAVVDTVFGFFLSGIMAGAVFALMVSLGYLQDVTLGTLGGAGVYALLSSLILMSLVGFWEELVFRGYILQNMGEGLGMPLAVVISCLLYALVHGFNPSATALSTSIIAVFGFLRIYGYLCTGQLWLSIGMHTGWNFFQATVFGYAASGHSEDWTLFSHEPSAEAWLSGGDFGPEGSVLVLPVLAFAVTAMWLWSGTRRQPVIASGA